MKLWFFITLAPDDRTGHALLLTPLPPEAAGAATAGPDIDSAHRWANRGARLDRALNADGQLIAAHADMTAPSSELLHPGRDPLVFSDLMRKVHRTDVGRDTIDQLNVITEQLCCEYVSCPPEELREDAHHQLEYVQRLLEGSTRLGEHRELLVIAGWLSLLIGCVNYDLGLARHAETARTAAFQLGREACHGEIVAWSFEVSAWFALTQGRLRSVLDYTDAGIKAAPHASVAGQLAVQAARAHHASHDDFAAPLTLPPPPRYAAVDLGTTVIRHGGLAVPSWR